MLGVAGAGPVACSAGAAAVVFAANAPPSASRVSDAEPASQLRMALRRERRVGWPRSMVWPPEQVLRGWLVIVPAHLACQRSLNARREIAGRLLKARARAGLRH